MQWKKLAHPQLFSHWNKESYFGSHEKCSQILVSHSGTPGIYFHWNRVARCPVSLLLKCVPAILVYLEQDFIVFEISKPLAVRVWVQGLQTTLNVSTSLDHITHYWKPRLLFFSFVQCWSSMVCCSIKQIKDFSLVWRHASPHRWDFPLAWQQTSPSLTMPLARSQITVDMNSFRQSATGACIAGTCICWKKKTRSSICY